MNVFYNKIHRTISTIGLSPEATDEFSAILASEFKDDQIKACKDMFNSFQQKVVRMDSDRILEFAEYVPQAFNEFKTTFDNVFETEREHLLKVVQKKHDEEVDLVYESGVAGYQMKRYVELTRSVDGIKAGLHIIAADPNVGKTALTTSEAIDLLISNKEPNVNFYTIDDPKKSIINRFIAILAEKSMNTVNRKRTNQEDAHAVNLAYTKIIGFIEKGRLDVFDSSDFSSAEQLMAHIDRSRNEKENLVVFVDGTTNLTLDTKTDDYHTALAMMFKEAWKPTRTGSPEIPIIITNELKKREGNRKPIPSDIKGSRKWEYAADCILLLFAKDIESFNRKTDMTVIVDIAKNKFSDKRGEMFMELRPEMSLFKESVFSEEY